MTNNEVIFFLTESNRIEGIFRPPTPYEIEEHYRFMQLRTVTIQDLQHFVSVYQPGAELRDRVGMDVRVGRYTPPRGGPEIREQLDELLNKLDIRTPYENHIRYESLHPFMDGNGRSGRMLWAWQMKEFPLGFLHHFYYQTLGASESGIRSADVVAHHLAELSEVQTRLEKNCRATKIKMKIIVFTVEITAQVDDDVDPNDVTFEIPLEQSYPMVGDKRVGSITGYCTQEQFEVIGPAPAPTNPPS